MTDIDRKIRDQESWEYLTVHEPSEIRHINIEQKNSKTVSFLPGYRVNCRCIRGSKLHRSLLHRTTFVKVADLNVSTYRLLNFLTY